MPAGGDDDAGQSQNVFGQLAAKLGRPLGDNRETAENPTGPQTGGLPASAAAAPGRAGAPARPPGAPPRSTVCLRPRDFQLPALLVGPAQQRDGADLAPRRASRANFAAQLHQRLVQSPEPRRGNTASAIAQSSRCPSVERGSPSKASSRLKSRSVLASRIGSRASKAIERIAPAV